MTAPTVELGPWSPEDAARLRATACRLFRCDYPHGSSQLERENCGACTLRGYRPRDAEYKRTDGPNYAGWARDYVQAGYSIPRQWRKAFERETASSNLRYAQALARDVATWGVRHA